MKKHETKKGFTLIELLIVIAIIAILAVAFLPTLLGAPAKGRDTARIADLQKIQKVLVNANLEKGKYPSTTGKISAAANGDLASGVYADANTWLTDFGVAFGGKVPTDPSNKLYYYSKSSDTPGGSYSFAVWALVENDSNANATCDTGTFKVTSLTKPNPYSATTSCYAILTQS